VTHPDRQTRKTQDQAFAIGMVTGIERTQIETCLHLAKDAGRSLAKASAFW
jgi:hypothetical protein